ncbi:MAG: glutamine amidotransferase [Chthoniobacterales bacterium]
MFTFSHPLWLSLIPPLWFFLGWIHWSGSQPFRPPHESRPLLSFFLRGLTASSLILALATPIFTKNLGQKELQIAIAIADKNLKLAAPTIQTIQKNSPKNSRVSVQSSGDPSIEKLLLKAQASLPQVSRILFFTQTQTLPFTNDSDWDHLTQSFHPTDTTSPIDIILLPETTPPPPEVAALASLSLPQHLAPKEPFSVKIHLTSNAPVHGTCQIFLDGLLTHSLPYRFDDQTTLNSPPLKTDKKLSTLEIILRPTPPSEQTQNNYLKTYLTTTSPPALLLVTQNPDTLRPLSDLLHSAKFENSLAQTTDLPTDIATLSKYSLILISNTPSTALSPTQITALEQWIHNIGGSLLVSGGTNSFSNGNYFGSSLEKFLPIHSRPPETKKQSSLALLCVLDRSGSMSARIGDKTKMQLANQAAAQALRLLTANDYFGIHAVDFKTQFTLPLQKTGNNKKERKKLFDLALSTRHGGSGIAIFTALDDAYRVLKESPASAKHLLLFADASDVKEKNRNAENALDLASHMLNEKISTSVVALGKSNDTDTQFLRTLAKRGNGRFYLTDDATSLPQLFALETSRIRQEPYSDKASFVTPASPTPHSLREIDWSTAPPLLGYQLTTLKPRATPLLSSSDTSLPILSTWNYGTGKVTTFTSDLTAQWSTEWFQWNEFPRLLTQLLRTLSTNTQTHNQSLQILNINWQFSEKSAPSENKNAYILTLHTQSDTPKKTLTLTPADSAAAPIPLRLISPDHYQAEIPIPDTRQSQLFFLDGLHTPLISPARTRHLPASKEKITQRLLKLAKTSGGNLYKIPQKIDEKIWQINPDKKHPHPTPLAPWFQLLAIISFSLEIFNRRL